MPHRDPEARKRYLAEWNFKNRERLLRRAAEYRATHAEQIAAVKAAIHKRRYASDPEYRERMLAQGKARWKSDPEKMREIARRSYEKNKERIRDYQRRHYATDERRARVAVNRAVMNGKIPRASDLPCAECGGKAREYHHHAGYDRANWLNVKPTCTQCHKDHHFLSAST